MATKSLPDPDRVYRRADGEISIPSSAVTALLKEGKVGVSLSPEDAGTERQFFLDGDDFSSLVGLVERSTGNFEQEWECTYRDRYSANELVAEAVYGDVDGTTWKRLNGALQETNLAPVSPGEIRLKGYGNIEKDTEILEYLPVNH
ncbi:MAG: hypothetical protein ABEK16_00365 [Candidatus Nanohalobium sp.]